MSPNDRARAGRLEQVLAAADARGEEPAFPLDEIGSWLASRGIERAARESGHFRTHDQNNGLAATRKELTGDAVWWHSEKLNAIGAQASAFAGLITCHEVAVDPPQIAAWLHALATWYPFEPESFADV